MVGMAAGDPLALREFMMLATSAFDDALVQALPLPRAHHSPPRCLAVKPEYEGVDHT